VEPEPDLQQRETVSLEQAISLFIATLRRERRAPNTVVSYRYDLTLLARSVSVSDVDDVLPSDIAAFLADANASTTRKRRLTSLRAFYRFLIEDARLVTGNPVDGFLPHRITASIPIALSGAEEQALLEAARDDEDWSEMAMVLMISSGATRSELLLLAPGDVVATETALTVSILRDVAVSESQRTIQIGRPSAIDAWARFRGLVHVSDRLFPVGPQAVNGMVERVRRRAKIERRITPRTLRDTYVVDLARSGASVDDMIERLGLVDEYRNRQAVQRVINAYMPPDQASPEERASN
jgi:integrase/recombinase XerD